MHLSEIYRPLTAMPFRRTEEYIEVPPCDALKPFIRCFWGTESVLSAPCKSAASVVSPDTCMDIIFHIDVLTGAYKASFCGIDERSHMSGNVCSDTGTAMFGIRFYPWSAVLFAAEDMSRCKNGCFAADEYFGGNIPRLGERIVQCNTIYERARAAEMILMDMLTESRTDSALLNGMYHIISTDGRAKIADICGYACVSERTLERLFLRGTGVSPKTMSSLMRYQLLWRDILSEHGGNMLDLAEKYGYTDQSHLLRDFKRRHLMSPSQAVKYAREYK